jgi:hypothetical protein
MESEPSTASGPVPNAIYLDANALVGLSGSTNDPNFRALRDKAESWRASIFLPDVAYREWKHKRVCTIQSKLASALRNARELRPFVELADPPELAPMEVEKLVEAQLARELRELGVTVVPTPTHKIELDELLNMAIRKLRPFEEKGEKGFRDTVILMTIADHMQQNGHENALLVSGDCVFDHPDIAERLKGYKLRIVRARDFADAAAMMKKAGWFEINQYMAEYSRKVCAFANTRLDALWDAARMTATVDASPLWGAGSGGPRIERVLDARPAKVTNAFEVSPYGAEPEVAMVILEIELDVIAEVTTRQSLLSGLQRFSLSAEDDFRAVTRAEDHTEMKRTTVTRDVTLEVELSKVNGEYTELRVRRSRADATGENASPSHPSGP